MKGVIPAMTRLPTQLAVVIYHNPCLTGGHGWTGSRRFDAVGRQQPWDHWYLALPGRYFLGALGCFKHT